MVCVSVIIPTYNRVQVVGRAIQSVLDQTYTDYEIILVDDGSTDETTASIGDIAGKWPLTVLRQPVNSGVSSARNIGIRAANGKYISLLDSDDLWYPRKLEVQVAYMESNPDKPVTQVGEVWIRNGKRVNPMNKHRKPSGDIFIPSLKLCLVSPSAVMIRRDLFDSVGLFDESLPVCEDYDMWLRISQEHEIVLLEEYLIEKHGGHKDQLSRKYWGMDRFRISSMEKILSKNLSRERRQAVAREIMSKSSILSRGALKNRNVSCFLTYAFKTLRYSLLY